jgi:hypothetical protein
MTRWWVVQATAVLESVATTNYACYGRPGVPRYPIPRRTGNGQEPSELCVELMARGADGSLRLACLDLTLNQHDKTDQRVVWTGYHAAQHLQVIWVWDFFRIQSHVALRVAEPLPFPTGENLIPGPSPLNGEGGFREGLDAAWQDALAAIRALAVGDQISFDVRAACGDIHQGHTLASPAKIWEPGK